MRATRRRTRGFTLIELMIVVAIIGVLAAIATPSFLRFYSKARQAEARTNLAAIYTAQMTYFSGTATFGEQFSVINWVLAGTGTARYNYGMFAGTATVGNASFNGNGVAGCGGAYVPNAQNTFSACAEGEIDNDVTRDHWRIDDNKAVVTVQNDLNL